MKRILLISAVLLSAFPIFSQSDNGIDSSRNVRWSKEQISMATRSGDSLIPYDYVYVEFSLKVPDRLFIYSCDEKTHVYDKIYYVPKECVSIIKYEPVESDALVGSTPPDSIPKIDYNCLEKFYTDNKSNLIIDTLWVKSTDVIHGNSMSDFDWEKGQIYSCEFKHGLKHGDEKFYFSNDELKQVCVHDIFKI